MKARAFWLLISTLLVLLPTEVLGQSEPGNKEHPGVVALSKDSGGVWAYKSFQESGKKVGYWSVIRRPDGNPQWAYKGQPVYMRFHDMPADPHAIEVEGFRPLKP
jgi:hypothetical protein